VSHPGSRRILGVDSAAQYDLVYDPNEVGADLVVECWISQSPRADDPSFDPQPGDSLRVGDGEVAPRDARVTRRDGNRVWVQITLPNRANAVA
jgi:hypothetical protein